MKRLVLLSLLVAAPVMARADGVINDCKPNDDSGCACETPVHICEPPDMQPPVRFDLSRPFDLAGGPPDARLERRHRRKAANGRGLILLSGVSVLALALVRRRYKTRRPTPAESALAASATRSDS